MKLDARPLIIALVLFALLHALLFPLSTAGFVSYSVYRWLPEVVTLVAAGVAGYLIRRHLLIQLLLLGVAFSVYTALLNLAWSGLGLPADFAGPSGSLVLALVSLPFFVLLSLIGGLVGHKANRHERA